MDCRASVGTRLSVALATVEHQHHQQPQLQVLTLYTVFILVNVISF